MMMLTIIFAVNTTYVTTGLVIALLGSLIILLGIGTLKMKKHSDARDDERNYYDDFKLYDDDEDGDERQFDYDEDQSPNEDYTQDSDNESLDLESAAEGIVYEGDNDSHISPRLGKNTTWKYDKLSACSFSVKGAGIRQQDSFRLPPTDIEDMIADKGALFILCDGMGSPTEGAIASNGCSNTLSDAFYSSESIKSTPHFLHDILPALDSHVRKMIGNDSPTGTTIVCSIIKNDELYLGSVGNSRLYVIRDEKMFQITKDHTYYQDLEARVMAGTLTLEEANNHPRREELTSYIGIGKLKSMQVNSKPVGLVDGDIVLMCSEGVYKQLGYDKILHILSMPGSLEKARMQLYNALDNLPEETRIDSTGILISYGIDPTK